MEELIRTDIERIERLLDLSRTNGANGFYDGIAEELQGELIAKYENDIKNIGKDLSFYWPDFNGGGNDIQADYISNLKKIKSRLEVFAVKIKEDKKKTIEKPSQFVPSITITNSSDNHSSNNNDASNTNTNTNNNSLDAKLLFEDAKKTINDDVSLSDAEVEDIINKINELEELHNSDESPRGKWSKSKEVMTWVMTKGPKIATTVLPLVTEIIKFNNK